MPLVAAIPEWRALFRCATPNHKTWWIQWVIQHSRVLLGEGIGERQCVWMGAGTDNSWEMGLWLAQCGWDRCGHAKWGPCVNLSQAGFLVEGAGMSVCSQGNRHLFRLQGQATGNRQARAQGSCMG